MLAPPLSLYVHLPWCVRKCPYCDFNSHAAGTAAPRARYINALLADLEQQAGRVDDRPIISVFLGGGTPSLFLAQEIAQLIDGIRQRYTLADDVEITMEANPGTVECGDPAGYRQAGVNRLSIGAQSFSDDFLQKLGRIHSVQDITRAVTEAQAAGFDSINIDIMYGLPGQDIDAALQDLRAASDLQPAHISWYQLTLEPNTVFYARPPAGMPDNDKGFEIQVAGQRLLREQGFLQYETSAYAREPEKRCRHNLNYWSFGDYLAVGAGAHGKLSDASGVRRYAKPANPQMYMECIEQRLAQPEPQRLTDAELRFEFMLNALRLADGFDESLFERRTGLAMAGLLPQLQSCREKGLLEQPRSGSWRATELGQRFLNDLQAAFLPEA
jgi:oxygen-independent coproporphyrinogen-3 oxidase